MCPHAILTVVVAKALIWSNTNNIDVNMVVSNTMVPEATRAVITHFVNVNCAFSMWGHRSEP